MQASLEADASPTVHESVSKCNGWTSVGASWSLGMEPIAGTDVPWIAREQDKIATPAHRSTFAQSQGSA